MQLQFTGRGAAFNAKEGNTSAYFIENETLFLIDCGESVFAALMKMQILSKVKEVYVLISHTHSDHCGSLGSLGFYCQYMLHTKLNIVVPHHEAYIHSLETLMTLFGNTKEAFCFVHEEMLDHQFQAFDTVRYDLTQHDDGLTCFSFVFESSQGAVFFSADTKTTDNIVRFMNQHEHIDRMYMEVTDLHIPGDIHLNIEALEAIMPLTMRSKLWMMHLRGDDCIARAKAGGFQIVMKQS